MTDLVPADQIEEIVGAQRHRRAHFGRAVSAEQTVYILHSELCRASGINLTDCRFSRALDRGIRESEWTGNEDRPVVLAVWQGRLVPIKDVSTGRIVPLPTPTEGGATEDASDEGGAR